jgi:threonine/homoserine/homoserine lactone efflux protein
MTPELFAGLFAFAAVSAWTPGPNNTILMASGLAYGFRKTLPMILGVVIGFPAMIAIVGLGLGRIFEELPQLYTIMKYAGATYMLWLAYRIASAKPATADNTSEAKPLTFLQGVAFQWINPKGWIMALTALSAYTLPANYSLGVLAVSLTFLAVGITSSCGWTMFGTGLRQLLTDPRWFRLINMALALALIASLVPMLRH